MGVIYLCPQCRHPATPLVALPPVHPLTTCRHCGHTFRHRGGSFVSAWCTFCALATFLIGAAAFTILSLLASHGVTDFPGLITGAMGLAILLAFLAALVGCVLGAVIWLVAGASEESRVLKEGQAPMRADPGCWAPSPSGGLNARRPGGSPDLPSSMRCWHCGNVFDPRSQKSASQVRCPGCQAGLGNFNPSASPPC